MEFGRALKDEEFVLDKDHTFINHGSYGSVAKRVHNERIRLMNLQEHNPDNWFRRLAPELHRENLAVIAEFLNSKKENLVFVQNATAGCNCVIKSIKYKSGDAILTYSYTYNAINNACLAAAEKAGAEVLRLNFHLGIPSVEAVVDMYRQFIETHKNIKLVVLDYISSSTGLLFPIKELVKICKDNDKLVLVDGAHTPGQIPTNLEEMGEWGVDFYTGNIHKWMYAPRGCAVLWTHPKHHNMIKPVVTSHCYNTAHIYDEFYTQGTKDDTPYYSVKTAVQFYNDLGGLAKIPAYCSKLLDKATDMLSKAWGTETFPVPKAMEAPYMRLVRIPDIATYPVEDTQTGSVVKKNNSGENVFFDMHQMMTDLYSRFHITTVCLGIHGKPWVRLAANAYNVIEDYELLRDAVLTLKQEAQG